MTRNQQPAAPKRYSRIQAIERISQYCAYQERSHKEVRYKLYQYGLHSAEVEDILAQLITDGFLNEERFAKAFAGGKFRIKKWGRNKIAHALQAHGVTSKCIDQGLREISVADYRKTLESLLKKRLSQATEGNPFKKKNSVAKFAIGKGYEPELVWEMLGKYAGRGLEL